MADLESTYLHQIHMLIAKKPQKGENHKGSTHTAPLLYYRRLVNFQTQNSYRLAKSPQKQSRHIAPAN
jgi:hypothetical protein